MRMLPVMLILLKIFGALCYCIEFEPNNSLKGLVFVLRLEGL